MRFPRRGGGLGSAARRAGAAASAAVAARNRRRLTVITHPPGGVPTPTPASLHRLRQGAGQVIGGCDRSNAQPAGDPVSTPNLLATVMHALFDVGTLRVTRGLPAAVVRSVETARPIDGLF